jgi:lysine 6-dehydrogenase
MISGGDIAGHRYAVVGAGLQGIAAAYDLARFGEADEIVLADINLDVANEGAKQLERLLDTNTFTGVKADANDPVRMKSVLKGITAFVSAVPYQFNLTLSEVAIQTGAHMVDLGGNTGIVRKQIERDDEAKEAGVSIVPDCGMGPGMNISLAMYAMSLINEPREVYIWEGGLPQHPSPPWNYQLTFNIGGLTNEYYGNAYFLRHGKIVEVPCFQGYEELEFPKPLGRLEAFVTSGGLSTMPWTFEGKLERLENRTLRYPGHWAQFKSFAELGLLETEQISVDGVKVVPRDVLHTLLEPRIVRPDVRDVCVIRTKCVGEKEGRHVEAVVELIDHFDEETGFTAMQRLTGWHASIVAILAAQGGIRNSVSPIELAVEGKTIVEEARRRGFGIEERLIAH